MATGSAAVRNACYPPRDSEPTRVLREVITAVVFESSDAVMRRRGRRADAPVVPQLPSESQPMAAPAALLEVPFVAVARLVSSPIEPLSPARVDCPALLLLHTSECASRRSLMSQAGGCANRSPVPSRSRSSRSTTALPSPGPKSTRARAATR
jgi:hypothetical protein